VAVALHLPRRHRDPGQAQHVTQVFPALVNFKAAAIAALLVFCCKISFRDLGRGQSCCVSKSVSLLLFPYSLRDCVRYANRELSKGVVALCGL
jgi:hypothetical protein